MYVCVHDIYVYNDMLGSVMLYMCMLCMCVYFVCSYVSYVCVLLRGMFLIFVYVYVRYVCMYDTLIYVVYVCMYLMCLCMLEVRVRIVRMFSSAKHVSISWFVWACYVCMRVCMLSDFRILCYV